MKLQIHIGVLANRNTQRTLRTWLPTADYLNTVLPKYVFKIVPLDFDQIRMAIQQNAVEFVIVNPGIYVEFETCYGINRLATLKRLHLGQAFTLFGGLIFCQADREDIQVLTDLRGKHFMAAAENSLGGWRMAWRELVEAGVNPYRDLQSLHFANSHDHVVSAIQKGQVDAGTVSTNVLEQMAEEGLIDLRAFKVINQQTHYQAQFPSMLSTRLYPEWPFAVTRQTPDSLAEEVAVALLNLPQDHSAAIAAGSAGWTIPLNYQPVHECFQVLQVPPYKDFGKTTSSFELAVKGSNDGLWDWNLETNEVFFSTRWKNMLGYSELEISNQFTEWEKRLHPDDRGPVLNTFKRAYDEQFTACELEYRLQHRNGAYLWILCRAALLRDVWGMPYRMAGSHTDITKRKQAEEELRHSELQLKNQTQQLKEALRELQQTQLQLIHSEKMSGLGQLVAGIAHEINNPVNFIHGNLRYLDDYMNHLLHLIEAYQKYYPTSSIEIQSLIEEYELDFIQADLPRLLNSMQVGSDRIREIVRSLRTFSRLDEAEVKAVDIHEGIENTLLILQHRLKPTLDHSGILICKQYGELPPIECYPGQLNQVFMNILGNAIDAVEEGFPCLSSKSISLRQEGFMPSITIQTELIAQTWVLIRIADTGPGIPEETKQRIFDPFFTTKPVGQGTGLGLSISYQIVVEQHRGKLDCYSEPGRGTEFHIQIPIHQNEPLRALLT